jgi:hypothetical protein
VDQLRQRSESNSFKLSHEEQVDVSFHLRKQPMEQYYLKMQQSMHTVKEIGNKSKNIPSKREDLAIILNQKTGQPQAMLEQEKPKSAPNKDRVRRRASVGGYSVNSGEVTSYPSAAYSTSDAPLRRNASLTDLEGKLNQLPGHSPPRQKQARRGSNSYTNQMTQQLETTILNANLPEAKTKRLLRRSSLGGGGSMHSSSMDNSSAHTTNAFNDDDQDNPYGYDHDVRPASLEIDAAHAMRRMRRSSIGGVASSDSDPYGYGDAAPNIRVLNPGHTTSLDKHSSHSQRRMRRCSVGGTMPTSDSNPYGYGEPSAPSRSTQLHSTSPNFEAAQAMQRMRRSSIGGIMPSSSSGTKSHGHANCPPNVRWISQLESSPRARDTTTASSEGMARVKKSHDQDFHEYGPCHSELQASPSSLFRLKQDKKIKKSKKKGSEESLRCLEQLALDMSGQSNPTSPKRISPRRGAPTIKVVMPDHSDGAVKRSPTAKMQPPKRVALGA